MLPERTPVFNFQKMALTLRALAGGLDVICLILSPFAILFFIVLMIIALDGFGEHVQFLSAIDHQGVEAVGRWTGYDPGDTLVAVELTPVHGTSEWAVVYTKYYSKETLAGLKYDQTVRVRYTTDPKLSGKAVLLDAYDQVKGYHGYITSVIWPLVICWLVVVIHPEFLFFALPDNAQKQGREEKPA